MKIIPGKISWFALLYIMWLVLFAHFSPFILISGIFICWGAIWYTEKYLLKKKIEMRYPIHGFRLLLYFLFLIKQIYASGFHTIKLILKGEVKTKIVRIHTDLKKPYLRAILANSISLTPGTVTVDLDGQDLLVLWLDAKTDDPELAGEMIKGALEEKLKEF